MRKYIPEREPRVNSLSLRVPLSCKYQGNGNYQKPFPVLVTVLKRKLSDFALSFAFFLNVQLNKTRYRNKPAAITTYFIKITSNGPKNRNLKRYLPLLLSKSFGKLSDVSDRVFGGTPRMESIE